MIGIEAAYGFGDGLFLAPLTKRISEKHGSPVEIAVQAQCADAFHNLPWISKIHHISGLHEGNNIFNQCQSYQITPNVYFPQFKNRDPNHSLIDTALWIGRSLALDDIDQRPLFIPTQDEINFKIDFHKPTIAIETVHKSGQSWANESTFQPIIDKYINSHDIIWLSNTKPPPGVRNLSSYSRRQLIMLLKQCETFFSVGSGFFCASLVESIAPPKTICLWIDDFYKYEWRLAELGWDKNITWVHSEAELKALL